MISETVIITDHAWRQFIVRSYVKYGELPTCPLYHLRSLMARAKEENLGAGAVLRLMDNGYTPARYYTFDCWRFVLTEENDVLVTAELIYMRPPQKISPKRRRRH
jgi:hypothetical protein